MFSISAPEPIVHGYSVLRVTTDEQRGDTTPVGVVAWDSMRSWFGTRVLDAEESISGVPAWSRKFVTITHQQLARWADASSVPYEPEAAPPSTDRFWRAASEILSTSVRLDPPRAMDPMKEPEQELEALFEAIVRPRQTEDRQRERIDGALSRALGELATEIPTGTQVEAFGGATETVRRGTITQKGVLLVDGVNLATTQARKEADALVSRVMRIRAAYTERPVTVIVGYTASPGGLNGERHMCEWIQKILTRDVYDLTAEDVPFREATRTAWAQLSLEDQTTLF